MFRFCIPLMTFGVIGGCVATQPTTSTNPTFSCTATRACTADGCESSDLEFNLSQRDPTSITISFVDSIFTLDHVETTSAALPDGPVSLTTYQDMTVEDGMRLTLANDGSLSLRARLEVRRDAPLTDTSALCIPNENLR